MSARIYGMIFERYQGGGGELLLALALGDHSHDDGTHIFPSVAALAAKTRQAERTVQYQLRKMEASGWLQKVRDEQRGQPGFGSQRRRGREYRISPEWIRGEPVLANPGVEVAVDKLPEAVPGDERKGANFAPFPQTKGCNLEHERVQSGARKGATAIAPKPSVNHQYSNHQGEGASASDPPPSPPESLTPSHGSAGADVLAEFPPTWQPCDQTRSLLAARKVPLPAQFVIDGFVGHWTGRWVAPRRIPSEFLKWVSRQAGMNGGKVPTDDDSGASKAEAEAAWQEVRLANQRARLPDGGWAHSRTAAALQLIGGLSSLRDMRTDQVPERQAEFVRAFRGVPSDATTAAPQRSASPGVRS